MNSKKIKYLQLIVGLLFVIFIILPIINMFKTIGSVDAWAMLNSKSFKNATFNSVTMSLTATCISISLGFMAAMVVNKTNLRYKSQIGALFCLPMLIPSISHGMGLIILLGANGILTNTLNLSWNIYGFTGVVIGSVMYSFPIAFLMISDILKYENQAPYMAAKVLNIPKFNQWLSITIPYTKKPLVVIFFTVFTMIITDYGVPLMVGGKFMTLPVIMYQDVIGLLNFGKGSLIGMVLLVPAILAFIIDLKTQDKGNNNVSKMSMSYHASGLTKLIGYSFCAIIIIIILLPIISFGLIALVENYPQNLNLSFNHIYKTFNMHAFKYLVNSLIIASFTSLIGAILVFVVAYLTSRIKGKSSKFLHLIAITSMAIPGLVLGLAYVLFFKGSFIFGTLAILVFVNIMHFFASPYLMCYNSLNKISSNIESTAQILGIKRFYVIKDIILPMSKNTIIEIIAYLFVNSMMTISAVAFLANIFNKPLSLMINAFEAQMMLECASVVSLIILFINILIKILAEKAKQIGVEN